MDTSYVDYIKLLFLSGIDKSGCVSLLKDPTIHDPTMHDICVNHIFLCMSMACHKQTDKGMQPTLH